MKLTIGTRAHPGVDELLDAAVGESAKEAGPLAVARHALEGADLVGAVEEDLDALAVDAHEHLPRVALAAGPGDPEDLVGHGALELGHGERARVHVAAPELAGQAEQDAARVLRDALDAGAPPQHGRGGRGTPARRRVGGGHRGEEEGDEAAAICGGRRGEDESFRFALEGNGIRGRECRGIAGSQSGSGGKGRGRQEASRAKVGYSSASGATSGASSERAVDTWGLLVGGLFSIVSNT